MAFSARGFYTIARQYLADLVARYADRGRPLNVGVGSDDAMKANALALQIAPIEANAEALATEFLPTTASPTGLARFAEVYNVPRVPPVAAVITWRVLATVPSTLLTFGSSVLTVAATGVSYRPNVATAVSSAGTVTVGGTAYYYADVAFTATTAGAASNAAAGTLATWSSAPAGAATIAQALATMTPGADEEDLEAWRARIVARMQERPGTFNRADVSAYGVEVTSNITDVYVYPLMQPGTTATPVPGCVTAVCMGPAVGGSGLDDLATDRRVPSPSDIALVNAYVEGTGADGVQKRPVVISASDYAYEKPSELVENITLSVTLDPAVATFPFSGSTTTVAGSTTSLLKVASVPAGAAVGALIQVAVGTAYFRGGVQVVTITSISGTDIGVSPPLVTAVPAGTGVYPAPTNYAQIRDAVIGGVFDKLGPGDTSPPTRWPSPSVQGPAVLYRQAIAAAVIAPNITGVLSASVSSPASDVTPAAKQVVRLGVLVLTP